MASRDTEKRPVIVVRKKVVHGGGHHGGSWKVAYADFVTADVPRQPSIRA